MGTLSIEVNASTVSEVIFGVTVQYVRSESTAILAPRPVGVQIPDPNADAYFGNITDQYQLEEDNDLHPGMVLFNVQINPDTQPEPDECFLLEIVVRSRNLPGRLTFDCNPNSDPESTTHYCQHEVCLINDDG